MRNVDFFKCLNCEKSQALFSLRKIVFLKIFERVLGTARTTLKIQSLRLSLRLVGPKGWTQTCDVFLQGLLNTRNNISVFSS